MVRKMPSKRFKRLEWIAAAFMGAVGVVLLVGLWFAYDQLYRANRQIDQDRGRVIAALDDTRWLLTNNIPLNAALDELVLTAHLFQNDLNTYTMDIDAPITPFSEYVTKLEAIAAELEKLMLAESTERSLLIDGALGLADIAEEASTESEINDLVQLHRDSVDPMLETNRLVREAKQRMTEEHNRLLTSIAHNNSQIKELLRERKDIYNRPLSILMILTFLFIVAPLLLIGLLFHQVNRRIQLLEEYANQIAQEDFQLPPFDSSDKTGSLARTLGKLSLRVDDLLKTTRIQAKDAEYQAHHDALTGLPNRRDFIERLDNFLPLEGPGDNPTFLLLLDLDDFKDVNDALGHDAGDELIRITGQRLYHSLHSEDHVSRIGGDEFAALMEFRESDLQNVAGRILETVSQPVVIKSHKLDITASIGFAKIEKDVTSEEMLKRADIAMYYVKQCGRNNYQIFYPELKENIDRRLTLIDDIRKGIIEQQFELYLQPKIDIGHGRIIGVECLIRWTHPEKGFMSPAEFIPLAEESGLIVPLGTWVLEEACRIAKMFYDQEHRFTVAVNCSSKQLAEDNFVESSIEMIRAAGLPLDFLELEVTETMLMKSMEETSEKLSSLKEQGVHIALDDFGTGYSSLLYLKELPITTLKIDRSFIVSAEKSDHDAAIIHAIATMGHNLNLEIVAEGVETLNQLKLLHSLDIHVIQGYIFAKPMPVADFQALLQDKEDHPLCWQAEALFVDAS
jgi:diguanylate cyclase (GGDEF)-like protein